VFYICRLFNKKKRKTIFTSLLEIIIYYENIRSRVLRNIETADLQSQNDDRVRMCT